MKNDPANVSSAQKTDVGHHLLQFLITQEPTPRRPWKLTVTLGAMPL